MASSLIRSFRVNEDDPQRPKVPGRIITTVAKAKELRPIVEKLITLARKAREHEERAAQFATRAERNSAEWKDWRESPRWVEWNQAIAPAVALRRRAFAQLRDNEAVSVLFDELTSRFIDRPGGYTRVVKLATVRLGDAGPQALIEFVGERDRVRTQKRRAPIVDDEETAPVQQPAPQQEEVAQQSSAEGSAPSGESPAEEQAS